jgi:hypothetical protein
MNSLTISDNIVTFIKTKVTGYIVKATPEAPFAPDGYDLLGKKGCILIWLDSIPAYQDTKERDEDNNPMPGSFIRKYFRFVISIGIPTLKDKPDLDNLVETIETNLINYDINGIAPLKPIGITRMTIDSNNVVWRQLFFESIEKLKIAVHSS